MDAMNGFIKNTIESSLILSYFRGPDKSRQSWAESPVLRIIHLIVNFPGKLLKAVYSRWKNVFEHSLAFRLLGYLADNIHMVTGLFLVIFMIVPYHIWRNEYGVLLAAGLAALFFIRLMKNRQSIIETPAIDYSILLFFVSMAVAAATSLFPGDSLKYLVHYILAFVFITVIVSTVDSAEKLDLPVKLIAFGTFLTSLYGIYQWKVIGVPVDPSTTDLQLNPDLGGRVYSTMGNANVYGQMLVLTIPFFAAIILNEKSFLKKAAWLAMLAPVILILFKTGSRGAWVALAGAALVFVFFWNIKFIPVIIILGLVALPLLPTPIYNRILTIFSGDKSTSYREMIYTSASYMLKDYWLTGVGLGPGVVSTIFERYKIFGLTKVAHSHVLYLQLWLEAGLAAILTFLLMIFRMVRNAFEAMIKKKDPAANNVMFAALSGIAGLLAIGLTDHVWFFSRIMYLFWINIALILAVVRITGIGKVQTIAGIAVTGRNTDSGEDNGTTRISEAAGSETGMNAESE
jgi:O-antigen ligase